MLLYTFMTINLPFNICLQIDSTKQLIFCIHSLCKERELKHKKLCFYTKCRFLCKRHAFYAAIHKILVTRWRRIFTNLTLTLVKGEILYVLCTRVKTLSVLNKSDSILNKSDSFFGVDFNNELNKTE